MAGQTKSTSRTGTGRKKTTSKKTAAEKARQAEINVKNRRLRDEIWSIIIIAVGIFLVVALQTEAAGKLGHYIATFLKGCFGGIAYVLPYYMICFGIMLFAKWTSHIGSRSVLFCSLIFLMLSIWNAAHFLNADIVFSAQFFKDSYILGWSLKSGGLFGMTMGLCLIKIIGKTGLYILCCVVILVSLLMVFNTPLSQFFENIKLKKEELAARRKMEDEDEAYLAEMEAAGMEVPAGAKKKGRKKKSDSQLDSTDDVPVIGIPDRKTGPVPKSTGQMKIMDYVKDEQFDEGPKPVTLGLEEAHQPTTGFGLDGAVLDELPKTMGMPAMGMTSEIKIEMPLENSAPNSEDEAFLDVAAAEESAGDKGGVEKAASSGDGQASDIKIELSTEAGKPKPFKLPPIDLLKKSTQQSDGGGELELQMRAAKLEETLRNFKVDAKVLQVTKGPAVTRYEIQPSTGVKVSSIVRLADDIALNLEAKSIRMEAPIPGKAAVGIEVENERVNMVSIRDMVASKEFKSAKSKISFVVGKDISGTPIIADLKGMPHLLIAGSTGSGKSVCINSLITSILYKAKPEEVRFVLIDPKVVELGNYNGIPHLLIPVVTDPSKAAAALNWAVAEMTDRYKKFAEAGVRDLASFNEAMKKNKEAERVLPQIVIIIDELADLMMAAPSQVEEAICRLAQMARAAGMHLIVATQRPSVDVITGVIKANIPSRIAFAVSSQFDSRTIIDMGGAEKLVGKGDMLFNPLGMAKPVRVQGAFISDEEVHNVIEFLKDQVTEAEYSEEVIQRIEQPEPIGGSHDDDGDELLQEAIETVVRAEQASVSMLQRRFRIGYNRAARLVDMMEMRGIVGPSEGSKPRRVLMTEDEFLALGRDPEEEAAEGE